MYQIITRSMFHDSFKKAGRTNNFSYEARDALYDYFTEIEEGGEHGIELDVIAICCEYSEEKIEDALENYNLSSIEELRENTCVIWNNHENVLYAQY